MSGNYNNPRLPDSTNQATADSIIRDILDDSRSRSEISPSGELYRAFERHMHRVQGGTENRRSRQLPPPPRMSSEQSPSFREQIQRELTELSSPLLVYPPQPQQNGESLPRSPASVSTRLARFAARRTAEREVNASRPRMTPSDRYMERARGNLNLGPIGDRLLEDGSHSIMQDATRQLETANSNGRARLDSPLPHVTFPLANSEYPGEREHRRVKRRKLDAGRLGGWRGFAYGQYGQVEEGHLKMELVSCDGGTFEGEPSSRREDFEPENVLHDDSSVYCTKSNRCNLVLRHQGSTTFCLTELVIKAPHQNFTAPIQEGLVFISMTSDDLLTRTAKYQIQYSPPKPRRSASERNRDEAQPIISIRHNGDGSMSTAQARARRLYDIGMQDEDCDSRTAQMPSDFTNIAPGFSSTTEQSDSEDDAISGRIYRASLLMGNFDSDSDSDSEEGRNRASWHEDYLGINPSLRRRETASDITLSAANQAASQEEVTEGDLMAPNAKFFIERDKSKTTIKFDPPVSGRFILLKLWSPHPSPTENIDIQTVIVKGYAGPRYFPAIQMK